MAKQNQYKYFIMTFDSYVFLLLVIQAIQAASHLFSES